MVVGCGFSRNACKTCVIRDDGCAAAVAAPCTGKRSDSCAKVLKTFHADRARLAAECFKGCVFARIAVKTCARDAVGGKTSLAACVQDDDGLQFRGGAHGAIKTARIAKRFNMQRNDADRAVGGKAVDEVGEPNVHFKPNVDDTGKPESRGLHLIDEARCHHP